MPDQQTPGADPARLIAALVALPGVDAARMQPDGSGPGLLRLSLAPGVDEAAVAGTVGKLLQAEFGIAVDADRVQLTESQGDEPSVADHATDPLVAQDVAAEAARGQGPAHGNPAHGNPAHGNPAHEPLGSEHAENGTSVDASAVAEAVPAQRTSSRPSISRVQLTSMGLDVTATVTLHSAGELATGTINGSASPRGMHRVVAAATLSAVEQLLGNGVRLDLDHVEVTDLGAQPTVLVRLTLLSALGTETLTGVAVVRGEVREAVLRATLAAVNRRFEMLRG